MLLLLRQTKLPANRFFPKLKEQKLIFLSTTEQEAKPESS